MQGKLAKASQAIRDGIMSSHYNSPLTANIQIRFYDSSSSIPIQDIHQQAIDNGADFIIGPLAKNKVELLNQFTLD